MIVTTTPYNTVAKYSRDEIIKSSHYGRVVDFKLRNTAHLKWRKSSSDEDHPHIGVNLIRRSSS